MQGSVYKSITPGELKRKLEGDERLVLLDVREPWEFALALVRYEYFRRSPRTRRGGGVLRAERFS